MATDRRIASPDLERDADAPYERVDELRQEHSDIPASVPPSGYSCNVGQHRKRKPATAAYRASVVDGQRVLVTPYVLAACADHERELRRIMRSRSERFARGGLTALVEPIA